MHIKINGHPLIPVSVSQFPDGQPHVTFNRSMYFSKEFVTLRSSIRSSEELVQVLLVADTLRAQGVLGINLEIPYLMGARMDRRIDYTQPFTLKVIADIIKTGGFDSVNLFDAHSDVAPALLGAENQLPWRQVKQVLQAYNDDPVIVIPDAGATKRVEGILELIGTNSLTVQCLKHRDSRTGKLSGFKVLADSGVIEGRTCIIVDDICDGAGTFIALAEKLRTAGAKRVILYVSHGIFSKGWTLPGIDDIWTTTSYRLDYPQNFNVIEAF